MGQEISLTYGIALMVLPMILTIGLLGGREYTGKDKFIFLALLIGLTLFMIFRFNNRLGR